LAVSIPAPREGRDLLGGMLSSMSPSFQSTPRERATAALVVNFLRASVSIHAPREGRGHFLNETTIVSIRAPREGRDST